jgi:hypothetical protein
MMILEPHALMATMEERISFTDRDKSLLKSHADWGLKIAPEMADHFYDYLGRDAEMNAILNFGDNGRIHRLHQSFVEWFHEMFTGVDNWGNAYADRRWKIGLVHVRVGIGPQHVVPAMAMVVHQVDKHIRADGKPEELKDALSRICMIDLAFIEQAYVEVTLSTVFKEAGWTEALFKRLISTHLKSMN